MSHTPGPWWIDEDGFVSSGGGDEYVTVADFDIGTNIDIMEREANKVLATAAPDLYGALKSLTEQVKLHFEPKKGPESLPYRDAVRVLKEIESCWEDLK